MKKFRSIESFKNSIKEVRRYCNQNAKPFPTLHFVGTEKLHGCFHEETPITLANGTMVPISKINVGDSILSYDIEKRDMVPRTVLNTWNKKLDKEWVKLTFSDGRTIKCTSDHKFFTRNRGWVEAGDLTDQDIFVTDF